MDGDSRAWQLDGAADLDKKNKQKWRLGDVKINQKVKVILCKKYTKSTQANSAWPSLRCQAGGYGHHR